MWNNFKAQDIVGEETCIDKLELVKDFLTSQTETSLTDREVLIAFLKEMKARA